MGTRKKGSVMVIHAKGNRPAVSTSCPAASKENRSAVSRKSSCCLHQNHPAVSTSFALYQSSVFLDGFLALAWIIAAAGACSCPRVRRACDSCLGLWDPGPATGWAEAAQECLAVAAAWAPVVGRGLARMVPEDVGVGAAWRGRQLRGILAMQRIIMNVDLRLPY